MVKGIWGMLASLLMAGIIEICGRFVIFSAS